MDPWSTAGMCDARFIQVPAEVVVNIMQRHCPAGPEQEKVFLFWRLLMDHFHDLTASGDQAGIDRYNTILVVLAVPDLDVSFFEIDVTYPGKTEF